MSNIYDQLYDQLILHEGIELHPYRCPAGKLTIGVGRNLEDKGISKEEARYILENDVEEVLEQLEEHDWFAKLDNIRQRVIVDMAFNLGMNGLLEFQNMIQCLKDEEYIAAAKEMINSRWHHQVGERAERLEEMMRTGEDYQ